MPPLHSATLPLYSRVNPGRYIQGRLSRTVNIRSKANYPFSCPGAPCGPMGIRTQLIRTGQPSVRKRKELPLTPIRPSGTFPCSPDTIEGWLRTQGELNDNR